MSRGTTHLAEVFKQYENVAGHDIVTAIKREFSGSLETALVALGKSRSSRGQTIVRKASTVKAEKSTLCEWNLLMSAPQKKTIFKKV